MITKLYWKIFFWFWLAMITFIIATAAISDYLIKQQVVPLNRDSYITNFATAAVSIYETAGTVSLQHWLNGIKRKKHLTIYILDKNKQDILNQKIPSNVQHLINKLPNHSNKNSGYRLANVMASPIVFNDHGEPYRLLAQYHRKTPKKHTPFSHWWIRFFLAMIISGIVCYLLSRYLTIPLRKLQHAAIKLGQGDFETRVSPSLGKRKDEIADLGNELDHMAGQISALLASQNRLLQDISHELRTPLARLQVALELAQRKPVDSEKQLERIGTEIGKMNSLIQDIVAVSRMQSSRALDKQDINLNVLLAAIINDTQFEYANSGKKIHYTPLRDVIIRADEKLLSRALENIIRNALRYATQNVVVETKVNEDIHIIISDDGPGVPEQELEAIFKPFYRVDAARNQQSGGYGLGLSIAKQAIELLGGKVHAVNGDEGGLVIDVLFPCI